MNHAIPQMTDPMARHWRQPSRADIMVDDTHAVMTRATFAALPEYSASRPSGVYPGKMWKRHDGAFDPACAPENRRWLLCWFGDVAGRPDLCSNNSRILLVSE